MKPLTLTFVLAFEVRPRVKRVGVHASHGFGGETALGRDGLLRGFQSGVARVRGRGRRRSSGVFPVARDPFPADDLSLARPDSPMSPSDVRRRCSITSGRMSRSSRRTRASWTVSRSSRCVTCYGTTGSCQRVLYSRCTCRRGADMSPRPRSTKARARSSRATRLPRTEPLPPSSGSASPIGGATTAEGVVARASRPARCVCSSHAIGDPKAALLWRRPPRGGRHANRRDSNSTRAQERL